MSAQPKEPQSVSHKSDKTLSNSEKIKGFETPELVIALCGPIGTCLHDVAEEIQKRLQHTYSYQTHIIKLSQFIEEDLIHNDVAIVPSPFKKKLQLISHGNKMRQQNGNDTLAQKAIESIHHLRKSESSSTEISYPLLRVCHIIDSIKNHEELELLRLVYRDVLHVVGVFSSVEKRTGKLKSEGIEGSEVANLIDQESGQEKYGQTVEDTFPKSDYFMKIPDNTTTSIKNSVNRFLSLVLYDGIMTPTKDENAMYAAFSASANSACLSRQVGAVVTDSNGEILSSGWNDVPKTGGGLYSAESLSNDNRCWNQNECSNDKEKNILAATIIETLGALIDPTKIQEAIQTVRNDKKLRGLIEFSRSIHAEMHAILSALSIAGDRVRNGKIFVTTYPCHSCARHIIAAGISEVYFLEPYKKSLAIKLHGDAITEIESDNTKVRIIPYEGVAPIRYLATFSMKNPDERKDKHNGNYVKILKRDALPKHGASLLSLDVAESVAIEGQARKVLEMHKISEKSSENTP